MKPEEKMWSTVRLLHVALMVGMLALQGEADILPDGRGKSPLMGWRTWNVFHANVNQTLMEQVMEAMAERKFMVDGKPTSYCDLGYCDVGLDDFWQKCSKGRLTYHAEDGTPLVNLDLFPDLRKMTDKGHKLGLKVGWYANNCICQDSHTNEYKFYEADARATVEYGFDSIKLDACGAQKDIALWNRLLQKFKPSGIVIENCHWGYVPPAVPNATWCPWSYYRTSGDISPRYNHIMANLHTTVHYAQTGLSRPGCWAYPDMLEVGVSQPGLGLNSIETRTHFAAWAITSSPLILSFDVRDRGLTQKLWPLLSNRDIIRVNQDWAGHSGSPFKTSSRSVVLTSPIPTANKEIDGYKAPVWEYFYKPLSSDEVAVLMINHGNTTLDLTLSFSDIPRVECSSCKLRDVFAQRDLGVHTGDITVKAVGSRDSVFYIVSRAAGGLSASH